MQSNGISECDNKESCNNAAKLFYIPIQLYSRDLWSTTIALPVGGSVLLLCKPPG
jgi:hypothetical protein